MDKRDEHPTEAITYNLLITMDDPSGLERSDINRSDTVSSVNVTGICFDGNGIPNITLRAVPGGLLDGFVLAGTDEKVLGYQVAPW